MSNFHDFDDDYIPLKFAQRLFFDLSKNSFYSKQFS